MITLLLAMTLAAPTASDAPGRGISERLARERAAAIRDLRYDAAFVVPADRREPVRGRVAVRFRLAAPSRIVLDFAQPRDRIRDVRVGGKPVEYVAADGHLSIAADVFTAGNNEVLVEFVAGDDALNRNDDFLYTLFVPARAHVTFPCFDQPDLRARYTLLLDVPSGWQTIANGQAMRTEEADGRTRVQFAETQPLSTYLFAFAAGKFSVETASRDGRQFRMLHRETDAAKVSRNRDTIFDLHASALRWLEQYTGVPYPFGKFDFAVIPSFQFGGMEHAGAIFYNASGLMLDESATQNQLLNRASLIAHETSHMWFGDLVTMRWFNDVWTKEVFANFMAAKIVNPSFPNVNHDLRFLLSHYPAAYAVDRTAGANPIRQPLANLNEAGQLYGPIIYEKAPIVMRQLEMIVGARALRDGLRQYLKRYAFGNATWADLVGILDTRTPEDLSAWSRAWVEERGRPEFTTTLTTDRRGLVSRLTLRLRDPLERNLVWPQRLRIALGYAGAVKELPVYVSGATTTVKQAAGAPRPLYVLTNGGGLGYGLFLLDDSSRDYLLQHLEDIPDALTRGSAWVTLWDNMLYARIAPGAFLDLALRALPKEPDEQNAQQVLAYVTSTFWRFLPHEQRMARAASLEATLRAGIERGPSTSAKSAWFAAFRDTCLTRDGLAWLERVWRREEKISALPFAETDEIAMALELAVRGVPDAQAILQTQLERTENPDRKARVAFVKPALSDDPAVREQTFERFRNVENRRREPWVLESLQYLHHPLRETHARRFLRPGLELLTDIQRTGDIFFPSRWIQTTLAGHRSREAAAIVEDFLASELQYPQRLRWIILSAADPLFRAVR
jgi:aminopeptidase N